MQGLAISIRRAVLVVAPLLSSLRLAAQQPDVLYRLEARVEETTGAVLGHGVVRYRHQGQDTLRWLTLAGPVNRIPPGTLAPAGAAPAGSLRITQLAVNGQPVTLQFLSPESDTSRVPLPPLATGDSATLEFSWTVAPATEPGAGRFLELKRWYPRIIDVQAGTSVPFPAFATFLLSLDVPEDQIIGGTGVPICGDPGWSRAMGQRGPPATLQRDWYPKPGYSLSTEPGCDGSAPGRKTVTWYAESVPEVAYAMSPDFVYEEGDFLERPVRVLYRRGHERSWGAGLATRRAETALAWVFELGGRYPWPHLTVIDVPEEGGEALPMLLLTNSPNQSAILGQLGLMVTQEILAGGARPFTVGTAAYQTAWFFETLGRQRDYRTIEREILDWDLDRLGLRDEALPFGGVTACRTVYCRRTEFMSYQLRRWAGSDPPIRKLYSTLYSRFLLKPSVPGAFQKIAGELIRPRPDSLYPQLLRGALYDDAVEGAVREPTPDGRWQTRTWIRRRAAGLFPQTLWIVADSDTVVTHAAALTKVETLTVITRTRPRRIVLDPEMVSHDWNMLNNQRRFGASAGWLTLTPHRPTEDYLDSWFTRRRSRSRLTRGWTPVVWFNDAAGWTLGGRLREDYLGRFELHEVWATVGTGAGVRRGREDLNARVRLRNPVWLRKPGWSQTLGLASEEGRATGDLAWTRAFRHGVHDTVERTVTAALQWFTVTDTAYLDPSLYDDAATIEFRLTGRLADRGSTPFALEGGVLAGYAYPNRGSALARSSYGRLTLIGSTRVPLAGALAVGLRFYGGLTISSEPVPRQRRIALAGADPYQTFSSPLLRSRGALLVRPDFYYHMPGGVGLRGLSPQVTADDAAGGSIEMEYAARRAGAGSFLGRVAIAAFGDGAVANGTLGHKPHTVADAGVGLRVDQHLGATSWQTRLDFPLWVSRPGLAQDRGPDHSLGFRWALSFNPAF